MKKLLQNITALFLVIAVIITNLSIAFADENNIKKDNVRNVGIFEYNNFQYVNSLGEVCGYNIELLNEIQKYTHWNYNYIIYQNKYDALEALDNNQIDFIAPIILSSEIKEKYNYTSFGSTKDYIVIVTKNITSIAYEDFEGMQGAIFGLVQNSEYIEPFTYYCKQHSISPTIKYYSTEEELNSALANDEITCTVTSFINTGKKLKVIGKIIPIVLHYVTNKNNDITIQLDNAINSIMISTPYFIRDLGLKYFGDMDKQNLSGNERKFISNQGTFFFGYYDDMFPFSYRKNKSSSGVVNNMCSIISKMTDIKFDFINIGFYKNLAFNMNARNIKILGPIDANLISNKEENILCTVPLIESNKYLYTAKDFSLEDTSEKIIAITKQNEGIIDKLEIKYPSFKFKIYDSPEECFNAVKQKKCDGVIEDEYIAQNFMVKPRFSKLYVKKEITIPESFCFIIYNNPNNLYDEEFLLPILNKSIINLGQEYVINLAINETMENISYSFYDFLIKYKYEILIAMLTLLLLFYRIYEHRRIVNKSIETIKNSEKKLRKIFNNIDGGLAVLLPDENYAFSYVNDGFQNIIDTSEKMLTPSFLDYVHPQNKEEFISFATKKTNTNSLTLKLRKRNGVYVYCMVKLSDFQLVNGKNELYITIFDITEKMRIDEELKLEKKRLEMIMDKAKEVMFEISYDNFYITDRFKKSYGWEVPIHTLGDKAEYILQCWKVHDDDKEKFLTLVSQAQEIEKPMNDVIRLKTNNNTYTWSKISTYPILDSNGKIASVLGKIQNVDLEIKEQQRLLKISQTDQMTGLLTKASFKQSVTKLIKNSNLKYCAFIFIDLDNFKSINDTFGHKMGDKAIIDASEKISKGFSKLDLIMRFGGDEFCVFSPSTSLETIENKIEALRKKIVQTYSDEINEVTVTASIGVCYCENVIPEYDKLFAISDKATYMSKNAGKNQYKILMYSDLYES